MKIRFKPCPAKSNNSGQYKLLGFIKNKGVVREIWVILYGKLLNYWKEMSFLFLQQWPQTCSAAEAWTRLERAIRNCVYLMKITCLLLNLSLIKTKCYASAADYFRQHCGKRRNFSLSHDVVIDNEIKTYFNTHLIWHFLP